ncbi:MAG: TolC family protein [Bdellovibrionota bacterium]
MIASMLSLIAILTIFERADASVVVLTVKDVVSAALKENPEIAKTSEAVREAEASTSLARSQLFTGVSGVFLASQAKDAVASESARFGGEPFNKYSFSIEGKQVLFAPGILSNTAMPGWDRSAREFDLAIASRDLTAKVVRAFYSLVHRHRRLDALLRIEVAMRDAVASVQKRHSIGKSQLLDVLQAKTQLALLLPKIDELRSELKIIAAELSFLMGGKNASEIHISGKLEKPFFEEIVKTINNERKLIELEKVHAQQGKLTAERSFVLGKHLPRADLLAQFGRGAYVKSDLLDGGATSWSLGLQLSIPIFSGLSSVHERQVFAKRMVQLELEEQILNNKLAMEQVRSLKSLEQSEELVKAMLAAMKLSAASLSEAKKNFRLGTIDYVQFLSVQQTYIEAQTAVDQAWLKYINSLVDYFVASGIPMDELVGILEDKTA